MTRIANAKILIARGPIASFLSKKKYKKILLKTRFFAQKNTPVKLNEN